MNFMCGKCYCSVHTRRSWNQHNENSQTFSTLSYSDMEISCVSCIRKIFFSSWTKQEIWVLLRPKSKKNQTSKRQSTKRQHEHPWAKLNDNTKKQRTNCKGMRNKVGTREYWRRMITDEPKSSNGKWRTWKLIVRLIDNDNRPLL